MGRQGLEIVFPYRNQWYRLDWDKTPDRFKELYVVWLKLQGKEIPNYLKKWETVMIDVENVNIEINLAECEEIPETYPLGA